MYIRRDDNRVIKMLETTAELARATANTKVEYESCPLVCVSVCTCERGEREERE